MLLLWLRCNPQPRHRALLLLLRRTRPWTQARWHLLRVLIWIHRLSMDGARMRPTVPLRRARRLARTLLLHATLRPLRVSSTCRRPRRVARRLRLSALLLVSFLLQRRRDRPLVRDQRLLTVRRRLKSRPRQLRRRPTGGTLATILTRKRETRLSNGVGPRLHASTMGLAVSRLRLLMVPLIRITGVLLSLLSQRARLHRQAAWELCVAIQRARLHRQAT